MSLVKLENFLLPAIARENINQSQRYDQVESSCQISRCTFLHFRRYSPWKLYSIVIKSSVKGRTTGLSLVKNIDGSPSQDICWPKLRREWRKRRLENGDDLLSFNQWQWKLDQGLTNERQDVSCRIESSNDNRGRIHFMNLRSPLIRICEENRTFRRGVYDYRPCILLEFE